MVFNGTTSRPSAPPRTAGRRARRSTIRAGGRPDSEGITRAELGSTAIYVSTERDNDNNGVSRLSILRFDTAAPGPELTATHEWNLTADIPAAGPNLGLEAITWIPDAYLVASGFIDDTTPAPTTRAAIRATARAVLRRRRGDRLHLRLRAGPHDGGFNRIATLSSGQPAIMDLGFDRDVGQLWAYCDNTCGNKRRSSA